MGNDFLDEQDITLAIAVFKGLDKKTPVNNLAVGASDICQNWRFDQNGWLNSRTAYSKYNSTSLGTRPLTHLQRIYTNASKKLLATYNTSVAVGDDSGGTFAGLKAGLTADQKYRGVTYKDFHYLFNGVDKGVKTDGVAADTDWMGCAVPSASISCVPSSCGSGTGDGLYQYKWNYEYDGYQESNGFGSNLSCTTDATHRAITIWGFPSSFPANCTHVNIYRTAVGGSVFYDHSRYAIGAISAYTTSAAGIIDVTPDASLGTNSVPTDNGIPPVSKLTVLHKDRIFLAGDPNNKSRVYFTHISGIISYPDIVPANNYIDVAPDDGDEITGLAVDPTGYLCVFKRNSIRKIFTDGETSNWSVSEPFSTQGCIAPYSIPNLEQQPQVGIPYLSYDGWRIFTGQSSKLIGENDRVRPVVINSILPSRLSNCVGHYHDNKLFLSYTDKESGATYNNRVLIYDILSDNFHTDIKNIDSFCTFFGSDDWGEIAYGDSQYGYVYKELASIVNVIYSKKSNFRPNGSLSSLVAWNTEDAPYLELGGHYTLNRMDGSSFNDFLSASFPSGLDSLPTNYSVSGTYTSPPLYIHANSLLYAYWNEDLQTYGDVTVAFRFSSTSAGLSGTWSSEYSNPAGSDITALTAQDWGQFRITMSTTNISNSPKVFSQGGYAFKMSYRVGGSPAETTINYDWRSGYMRLTEDNSKSRLRKFRLEHEGTTGVMSCLWDMDNNNVSGMFCINLADNPKTYDTPFPQGSIGRKCRLEILYDRAEDLIIKSAEILHSPQPQTFM